jgi:hypothetical protein
MSPGRLDWPRRQQTDSIYHEMLGHYAAEGYGLVENGDIEDYWLAGGSAYGACFDLARAVLQLLPISVGRPLRAAIRREHLRRIVASYRPTYDRVRSDFLDGAGFVRVTGNHDDWYETVAGVRALQEVFPGLRLGDFVVLDTDDGEGVGVIFHGHQTDGWNGPVFQNRIARFTTTLGAGLQDQRLIDAAPGIPGPEVTQRLLAGGIANRLTRLNGITGATLGLDSLDEVALFESARRRWGRGSGDLEDGPWLILGHTHIPLASPCHPQDGGRWLRYRNGGSGVTFDLVTGVEWDGTEDQRHPRVCVVGWTRDAQGALHRVELHGEGDRLVTRRPQFN